MTDVVLSVRRGMLLFSAADFEALFGRAPSVVLLRSDADLLILPLTEAAIGGHLVKLRNAAGDRAVDALDFFRTHELPSAGALELAARWDAVRGALVVAGLFGLQT